MFSRSWTPLNIFGANPRLHQTRFQHLVFKPIFHSYEAPWTIVPNVWFLPYFFWGCFNVFHMKIRDPRVWWIITIPILCSHEKSPDTPLFLVEFTGCLSIKASEWFHTKTLTQSTIFLFFHGCITKSIIVLKNVCADSLLLLIIMIPMKVGLNGHLKSILAIPIGHDKPWHAKGPQSPAKQGTFALAPMIPAFKAQGKGAVSSTP